MGVSPLQFKHDPSYGNWYQRGEQNLEYRFGQVLKLQPDMVELQTWNDAGGSHYMGNSWPDPIEGTNIASYTANYSHTAYKEILPAFVKAYKSGAMTTNTMYPMNGKNAQGAFWHHTLLANGDCSSDSIGKPQGVDTVEDKVTVSFSPSPPTNRNLTALGRRSRSKRHHDIQRQHHIWRQYTGLLEARSWI
jgi:glucan endo-1,3-alpha-glucosidase